MNKAISEASGGLSLKDLAAASWKRSIPIGRRRASSHRKRERTSSSSQRYQMPPSRFTIPKLRELLIEIKKKNELTIDHVSQDQVIEAGFSAAR